MTQEPKEKDSLQPTISVDQFTGDSVAVQETRAFMASETGKKLTAMLRGLHPLRALIAGNANSPAVIREAARQEAQSSDLLLGRITGFEIALKAVTETCITVRPKVTQQSRRSGRDIPAAASAIPTR
jgi:hypothetical protein